MGRNYCACGTRIAPGRLACRRCTQPIEITEDAANMIRQLQDEKRELQERNARLKRRIGDLQELVRELETGSGKDSTCYACEQERKTGEPAPFGSHDCDPEVVETYGEGGPDLDEPGVGELETLGDTRSAADNPSRKLGEGDARSTKFRVGDKVRDAGSGSVLFVAAVSASGKTVTCASNPGEPGWKQYQLRKSGKHVSKDCIGDVDFLELA